ncbi:MAG: anaerobic ribonucleoside-triphosphate reductase activating protein [Bacteroidales bacterium]|nr:anaerobic ribonucleoside-triphosphate reductase activating protein [Bacteroidales bacterium]
MLKVADYDVVFAEVPDEVTLAMSLSLCPIRCTGCHSQHLWGDVGLELTTDLVDGLLHRYEGQVTCLCFMGGDNDPEMLHRMAAYVKGNNSGLRLAWYSGQPQLPQCWDASLWNYVKLGPYVKDLGPLSTPTTNQRLYRIDEDGTLVDITYRLQKGARPQDDTLSIAAR